MYLSNAFSLNMLDLNDEVVVKVAPLTKEDARALLDEGYVSVVGHADTAAIYSTELGIEVPFKRETLKLKEGDEMVVGQYFGPRLPEGATTLPPDASIKWVHVKITR